MRLLLDTHIFLWYITGNERLPESARKAIQDPANSIFLSVVSVWEIILKHQIGKLSLPDSASRYVSTQRERHQIASLALDEASVNRLGSLPLLHRDPFDRMLVCQALELGLNMISVDPAVRQYHVPLFTL